jgi:hypothetical protein
MPRATTIVNSFATGEITPLLMGRTDVQKYFSAATTCENFVTLAQGPAKFRPGFRYCGDIRANAPARLVEFVFSARDTQMIEMTGGAIRFWRDRALVLQSGTANPYEIGSPYASNDVAGVRFAQSADVLFLVHPNHPPKRLERRAIDQWSLVDFDFKDGPYLPQNTGGTTVTPSGTTGTITLTASDPIFQPGHIGSRWSIQPTTGNLTRGWVVVTAYTSPTVVTALVRSNIGHAHATTKWREGAWSAVRGWPSAITFHEGRLWFGATRNNPSTVWGSKSNIFDDFGVSDPLVDDDGVSFTPSGRRVNKVEWLESGRALVAGTAAGPIAISGGNDGPITPSNVLVKSQQTFGCSPAVPQTVEGQLCYVQRSGRKVRELGYAFAEDNYNARDLTVLAEHVTKSARPGFPDGVQALAYVSEPAPVLWALRNDGALLGMTYERGQEVIGWHRHITDGVIEAIAPLPAVDASTDDLWCVVRRVRDGQEVRCMETLRLDGEEYLDSHLTYSGPPVSSVAGLDHLNGQQVAVLVDGFKGASLLTVAGGAITLPEPAQTVVAGLPYTGLLTTVRLDAGAADGTAQGRVKAVSKLRIRLDSSRGGEFGRLGVFNPIITQTDETPLSTVPPLSTGDYPCIPPSGYDTDGRVSIRQADPFPLTVVAIIATVNTND